MQEVLLWRTLSRYPDLESSLPGTAEILAEELPLQGMKVLLVDPKSRRLKTVAEDWRAGKHDPAPPGVPLGLEQMQLLQSWHRAGSVRRGPAAQDPLLCILWPEPGDWEVIAGPLKEDGTEPGVLLLLAGPGSFSVAHEALALRLIEPLSMALATDRRFHELKRLRETLEADKRALLTRLDRQEIVELVVGADTGLAEVMEKVEQVAPTTAPVLIFGESGAGKEVVARAIHARSPCNTGPMVRVNCGAISPGLVDSELFGHERGSFTGAVSTHTGWFERADGGTLFLDEIGELPLEAQVRLLRVLQEGVLQRVGGSRPIHVSVRIVAATHRNLEEMVREGRFREDLWYRLSVFPLYLPPLRERPHDIPELAAHFAARVGRRLGGSPLVPSPKDMELLVAYDWPGNVRELAAVIERAAILGNGRSLHIPSALGARAPRLKERGSHPVARERAAPFFTLEQMMRRHIEEALSLCRGQIEGQGGAAQLLAINPHTLRSRMRKLGITWNRFRSAAERRRTPPAGTGSDPPEGERP